MSLFLTIRCLLIAPNPESALNEEAGRLLLEDYDEYMRQAKLYTEIHAPRAILPKASGDDATGESSQEQGPMYVNIYDVAGIPSFYC